jgi:hypothetical protein
VVLYVQEDWKYAGLGSLDNAAPILCDNIKQWKKDHFTIKASVFTKDELLSFHQLPRTAETILLSVYATCAIAVAGRGIETYNLQWEDIKKTTVDGKLAYMVKCVKSKGQSDKSMGWDRKNVAWVTGEVEVNTINQYMACFESQDAKKGRFIRKLTDRVGGISSTNQIVGKNTAANYGEKIAEALGLSDSKSYTGHCFKRTSITFGADSGMSMVQLKAHSEHKSDYSVQQYIDQSMNQKLLAANSVFLFHRRLHRPPCPLFKRREPTASIQQRIL